jgi:TrmH RNA methyltransferase
MKRCQGQSLVDSGGRSGEAAAMKPDVICGAQAVGALFARRPDDALRLFYAADLRRAVGPWCAMLAAAKKPYRLVEEPELAKVAATQHHGGVAVVAKPRVPRVFDPANPPLGQFILVLDGVGNPHNLGAIARSAAFFGVPALLIGEGFGAALPSGAAYRTAEGGLEWLDLYRSRDLPAALAALAPHYRTVAASLSATAEPLADFSGEGPVALVLGNEETGCSPEVLVACRRRVRIPGAGRVESLNVAQAAAVLLHALCG